MRAGAHRDSDEPCAGGPGQRLRLVARDRRHADGVAGGRRRGCRRHGRACERCRGDRPSHPTQRPAAAGIEWREIGAWSGRLSQQTESFEVSTTPMRLRWQTTSETSPGAGRLTVTLHSTASGRPLQTIVDAQGLSSGTVDVADEPRWSYFAIEAANVEWQMTLEQAFASRITVLGPRRYRPGYLLARGVSIPRPEGHGQSLWITGASDLNEGAGAPPPTQ